MNAERFSIRYAETAESREALGDFINPAYLEKYATAPPLADMYAVVEVDSAVAACMGLEFPGMTGIVGIERAHRISRARLSLPVMSENVIQLSRWVADHSVPTVQMNAGMVAVLAAVSWSIWDGRSYAFVEHDETVLRRSKLMGIRFWHIDHASLNLGAIREENRAFYAKNTLKPYLVDLRQMQSALAERTASLDIVGL